MSYKKSHIQSRLLFRMEDFSRSNADAIYKAPECRLLQMQYVLLTCSHLCSLTTGLKKRSFTNGPGHAGVVLLAYAHT